MPEFAEIFRTKQALDAFNVASEDVLQSNTSIEEAKTRFIECVRTLKDLCEVVKPHPNMAVALTSSSAAFKKAFNDTDYFPEFLAEVKKLIEAVQRDVDIFLADGATPGADYEEKELQFSAKHVDDIRQKARKDEKESPYILQKEALDKKRIEEEKLNHQRLLEKERQLMSRVPGVVHQTPKPQPQSQSQPSSQSQRPVEILKDVEKANLSKPLLTSSNSSASITPASSSAASSSASSAASSSSSSSSTYSRGAEPEDPKRHRFEEISVSLPTKCRFCQDHILFGKALKCNKCSNYAHKKCETPHNLSIYACRESF